MEHPTVPPADDPPPEDSPAGILARIDAREREIERALREAREAAAAQLRDARAQAERILAARREQVAREAAEAGERIVAEAGRSAEQIAAAGAREAAVVRATPRERVEQAAEALLAVVLPEPPPGGAGR